MRSKFLGAAAVVLSIGLASSAQPQTQDTLQGLKDSLSPDQQSSIMQSVLGKGNGTGKQSDKKLETPETMMEKTNEERQPIHKIKKVETYDGRILRQTDEDPELRPDDTVIIDLTAIELAGPDYGNENPNSPNGANRGNGTNGGGNGNVGNNGNNGNNNLNGLAGVLNGSTTGIPAANNNNPNGNANDAQRSNPNLPEPKIKTDEEKEKIEKVRKRILSGNPYQLNHAGALEIPGMPAIPLAGLTAFEATKRLRADSQLSTDYAIKLTLLRLLPSGEEALKPFGYDLFKGLPSTFAPVSDIQVPIDYVVGPGDTLEIQLFGNEPALYELTVQRDGRINFPKLGPIMVSSMNFDAAREAIERRVAQQLPGARISVTMGDLRSIRVFVLGEAEK